MLGIVSASGAGINAGSCGVSMARHWSGAGTPVLLIDADPAGPPLAHRYGAAVRTEYSPETRGLPSLIAAREPLTLKSMAEHCYSLDGDGDGGSQWALFGPSHPGGARYAAQWLAERFGDLMQIDRQRSVIVASSLDADEDAQIPLLKSVPILVVLAPMRTRYDAEQLRFLCHSYGLFDEVEGSPPQKRMLIIEGQPGGIGDNEAMGITKLYVGGRLPLIEDEKLLRSQASRKDKTAMREFDKMFDFLLQVAGQEAHPATGADAATEPALPGTAAVAPTGAASAAATALANEALKPRGRRLRLAPSDRQA